MFFYSLAVHKSHVINSKGLFLEKKILLYLQEDFDLER